MKKLIVIMVLTAGILTSAFTYGSCHGQYARKVGEYDNTWNTKMCVYKVSNKNYNMLWDKIALCPLSIEINTVTGQICKIN